jgi:hypothetical protein
MRVHYGISSLLVALLTLYAPSETGSTTDELQLIAIPELISQKYCPGDADLFSVNFKLRVKYENHTDKALILDKQIGKNYDRVILGKSKEDLAAGNYEYDLILDKFGEDLSSIKPSKKLLRSDFIILSPGQIFESEIGTSVTVQYENTHGVKGAIRSGIHFLQIEFSGWNHPGDASEFEKSWRKYGHLVTKIIDTEPIEIRVPPNPKVEEKCE